MRPPTGLLARAREPRWRRRVLALADQGASSLSNILVFVLVARSFDSVAPVGAFSVAMLVYQLLVGATRGLTGRAFLSLYSHVSTVDRQQAIPALMSATFAVALLASGGVALIGLLFGGMVGSALVALAVVLPAVLVQDTWRFALIVDRPVATLALDVIWLVAVLAAFPLVPKEVSVTWFIYAWGTGALLGVLAGWPLAAQRPSIGSPRWWITRHREVGVRYAGEFATARAANYLVTSSLGAISGLATLGAVRASQVYYGPLNTLHGGIALAVVPEGAQLRKEPARLHRLFTLVSCGLAAVAGVWILFGLLLPDGWGEAALGATWDEAEPLFVPMGLGFLASGVMSGALLGLQSLADARRSFRARMIITPFEVVLPLVGALAGGAVGFANGFAATRVLSAWIMWRAFSQSLAAGPEPAITDGDQVDSAQEQIAV